MVPRLWFGACYFFFDSWRYPKFISGALAGDTCGDRASLPNLCFDQTANKAGDGIWRYKVALNEKPK